MTSYHHGDLRNTLIQLGVQMLIESGEAGLSLRKLAARAGVSHNAPYQHFADKDALVAAIAEEGFKLLGQALEAASVAHQHADPLQRLAALGRCYVRFALEHRGHIGVMFSTLPSNLYPDLLAESRRALYFFIETVQAIKPDLHSPTDTALLLWMTMHGLSNILIADKLPEDMQAGRTPEELAAQFTAMICAGILN